MDVSKLVSKFNHQQQINTFQGSSDLTEEKRLRYWLSPVNVENNKLAYCTNQPGRLYHDKYTQSQNKHYLHTHPYSEERILQCQVPSTVMYSPEWFVKMTTKAGSDPTNDSKLVFGETNVIANSSNNVLSKRLNGGGGNDVPLGRPTLSCNYFDVLRKRYTTSKHGVAKSKRAIAAKTATETHRGTIVSSWQNCRH